MKSITKLTTALLFSAVAALAATGATVAAPPLGFTILCINHPSECQGGGSSRISATPETVTVLRQVNAHVNRSLRPRPDGKADVWTISSSVGDCEEYALTKRRQLIRAGLPASALRIAFVKLRDGRDHAILVVNTDDGKFVLDNLTATIKPLSQTGYRVIAIQTANPKQWI